MTKLSTRDLILQVALILLNERGESIVTSVDLANEMNISPGNLYYHFKGKEQVVEELYTQFQTRLLITLQEIASQARGDAKQTLAGLLVIAELMQQFKFISQDMRGIHERYTKLRGSLAKLLVLLNKTMVTLTKLVMDKSKEIDSADAAKIVASNMMYTLLNYGSYDALLISDGETQSFSLEDHLYFHFLPYLERVTI